MVKVKMVDVYVDEHAIVIENKNVVHRINFFMMAIEPSLVCLILPRLLVSNQCSINEPYKV
jgi:hypothetical protein